LRLKIWNALKSKGLNTNMMLQVENSTPDLMWWMDHSQNAGAFYVVYRKHEWILSLHLGPIPKIYYYAYTTITKVKKKVWNLKHFLDKVYSTCTWLPVFILTSWNTASILGCCRLSGVSQGCIFKCQGHHCQDMSAPSFNLGLTICSSSLQSPVYRISFIYSHLVKLSMLGDFKVTLQIKHKKNYKTNRRQIHHLVNILQKWSSSILAHSAQIPRRSPEHQCI
jgi:hypothetical protein